MQVKLVVGFTRLYDREVEMNHYVFEAEAIVEEYVEFLDVERGQKVIVTEVVVELAKVGSGFEAVF